MLPPIARRHFLAGLSVLTLQACAATSGSAPGPGGSGLGHVVIGDGPEKVLVLHEWLGDHTNYDDVVPYLPTDRATFVFADLRGYGLSRDLTGDYSLAEIAADCLTLMDKLGIGRFQVVGHSMSGMVAQYLAATQPDRITGIVCISPVPATGFKTDAAGLAKLGLVITDDQAARAALVARTANRYNEAWMKRKLAMIRRAAPQAMDGYMRMFAGNDFADKARNVTQPVSLICGGQDLPFYRLASLGPMFGGWYRSLRTTQLHDAGHYSMLEVPVLLASVIEKGLFGQALPDPA